MKIKNISKLLIGTVLLSNINLPSFAGVLSDDRRYETFEGNSITINDILEEDKIDVEIQGNTLVNMFGNQGTGVKNIDNSGIRYRNFNNVYLKPNETYTVCANITNLSTSVTSKLKMCYEVMSESGVLVDVYPKVHYTKENVREGLMAITFTTDSRWSEGLFRIYVDSMGGNSGGIATQFSFDMNKCMLLEGNWSDKEIPEYFEGMKSVGELENNKLNIEALGENLFDVDYFTDMIETYYDKGNYGYEVKDGKNTIWTINDHKLLHGKNLINNNYKFKENTQYVIKSNVFRDVNNPTSYNSLRGYVCYSDGTSTAIFYGTNNGVWESKNIITDKNKTVKNILFTYGIEDSKAWFDLDSLYIGEYNSDKTEFNYGYNVQNLELNLNEPLRSLPNGVEDRIIKKNGQWVVERNCKEVTVDGSEEWIMVGDKKQNTACFFTRDIKGITFENDFKSATPTLSNLFVSSNTDWLYTNDDNVEISYTAWDGNLCFSILKSKLSSVSVDGFKEWLSINNPRVIYQLPNPIYEPLNVDSILNLYLDTTYISNDSIIPANMRIIVDRVINRAQEAIELVKSNPTIENISQARYWSNLMKESTLKDEFQNEINTNTDIEDLTIEKKTTSANVDIYLKMKNSLSLSLDTNSITFENFNASEDLEMREAVNLTVSSSLPYKINACLESELYNSDKSAMIDKSVLNIKNSSDTEYKSFNDVLEPLLLLDNQMEGDSISHSIDLILRGGSTHKADVYKTTIKFEVEQK